MVFSVAAGPWQGEIRSRTACPGHWILPADLLELSSTDPLPSDLAGRRWSGRSRRPTRRVMSARAATPCYHPGMRSTRSPLTLGALAIAAALPWYAVFSGTYGLYFYVLVLAPEAGRVRRGCGGHRTVLRLGLRRRAAGRRPAGAAAGGLGVGGVSPSAGRTAGPGGPVVLRNLDVVRGSLRRPECRRHRLFAGAGRRGLAGVGTFRYGGNAGFRPGGHLADVALAGAPGKTVLLSRRRPIGRSHV